MAITLSREKAKQRYLLLALVLIVFVSLIIVWFGFFRNKETAPLPLATAVIYIIPKVEIDWQMLDDLKLKTFQPFEDIGAFEGKFGRKNPFTPY